MKADQILRELKLNIGSAKKKDVMAAFNFADGSLFLTREKAIERFNLNPINDDMIHLRRVLLFIGCEQP